MLSLIGCGRKTALEKLDDELGPKSAFVISLKALTPEQAYAKGEADGKDSGKGVAEDMRKSLRDVRNGLLDRMEQINQMPSGVVAAYRKGWNLGFDPIAESEKELNRAFAQAQLLGTPESQKALEEAKARHEKILKETGSPQK